MAAFGILLSVLLCLIAGTLAFDDNKLNGIAYLSLVVDDRDKAIEFYTKVLGGMLVEKLSTKGEYGDALYFSMFQKEIFDAEKAGKNLKDYGVCNKSYCDFNAPVNVTPQVGADPGDSDRAKYRGQKSPPGAKIPCQNPWGQKKYFLPFLFKSSDFALGGGRKLRQKSPPRGKMPRQMPRGRPPSPPWGVTLTGASNIYSETCNLRPP